MSHRRVIGVPCPHCLARAGCACHSARHRRAPPHKARIMSAYHVIETRVTPPEPPQASLRASLQR